MITEFVYVWTTYCAPALGGILAWSAFAACLLVGAGVLMAAVQTADYFLQRRSKK